MMKTPSTRLAAKRFQSLKTSIQTTDFKLSANDVPAQATIFSMVQPTGKFHLGNYLGAVRVWKDLCDLKTNQNLYFGVADLHAITIPKPDASNFKQLRLEAIASLLSIGIDPLKAHVFFQSSIPQHAELNWMLSTFAPMGYLNRMTQWKSKSNIKESDEGTLDNTSNVKLGLFAYPVLQAADILLYKSTHVPVGEDQSQHLELTRTLAENFNKMYKKRVFPLPKTMLAPTKKILSLNSVAKKMSKSDPNQNGVVYLNDSPEEIARKIKKAVTDNISEAFYYDPINRPGVSNLINMISGTQRKSISAVEKDIAQYKNHQDFKNYVTEVLVEELKEPRLKYDNLIQDLSYLEKVQQEGASKASEVAEQTLDEVKTTMGFK
ncbi:Tryptophan--tRNA ligase, mitochondrial [Hanseniaspora osmophila]